MKELLLFLLATSWLVQISFVSGQEVYYTVETIAGTGADGFNGDGNLAISTSFWDPRGVSVSQSGDIYVVDLGNQRIRKIAPNGIVTTIAGNGVQGFYGDGIPATFAQIANARTSYYVEETQELYFSDCLNHRVRKINASGIISTIAGTGAQGYTGDNIPAISATFTTPWGLHTFASGEAYVADAGNQRIRRIRTDGIIETIAGTGVQGYGGDGGLARDALFSDPLHAFYHVGELFIADSVNNRIRKIDRNGYISTIAGNGIKGHTGDNGPATSAQISHPTYVVVSPFTGEVFFGVTGAIRKITTGGIIKTVAGNGQPGFSGDGGLATDALMGSPWAFTFTPQGSLLFTGSNRIRRLNPTCSPGFALKSDKSGCEPICFGLSGTNACSSRGACTSRDVCLCCSGYSGSQCEHAVCWGYLQNDTTSVCSGRGACVGPDSCMCQDGFRGVQCEETCWDSNSIGAPNPQISSHVVEDGIQFSYNFSLDPNVEFIHLALLGDSSFDTHSCSVQGGQRMNLTVIDMVEPCRRAYSSPIFTLDQLIENSLVKKEMLGDVIKLTIPLSLYYLDEMGLNNGGFCRAYQFTTSQIVFIKLTTTVFSSFDEFSTLLPYSVNLYPQEFSTNSSTGVLNVKMVLKTTNATLHSFSFHNTTNTNYIYQVRESTFWYRNAPSWFYQIQMHSNTKVSDFRALTFFRAVLKREGVLDEATMFIPLKIDYMLVIGPSEKNFTLKTTMYLASGDWSPKTTFKSGERVFAQVQTTSSTLGPNNRLVVNEAYLCCFKEFRATISYDPENHEYGCSQFNAATMDVWKPIITNRAANSEVETILYPFPGVNALYGFSFRLIPSMFPYKYSNTSSSCFVQSNTGLNVVLNPSRNVRAVTDTGVSSSLFVVQVEPRIITASSDVASTLRTPLIGITCFITMFFLLILTIFQ
ncbi:hypothetical protein C9374_013783 [Naegleria lovaniensis]|uniref:EGF-like domain-containing protein n=1 Tax=Naegleria lovaniensis TaxID=51637 RepID=A0AA88KDQ3_NAELO|nr:uncharacterized protein C9374_013783 [Naegleria lovaniensis]KAG2370872.1 hypothetical protein C9374_013783 [Naegleria lovaniensis]